MSVSDRPHAGAARATQHVSFVVFEHWRYLKIAIGLSLAAIVIYLVDRPLGGRYGGSWAGYTLGTAGAGLIVWLTWYGYRKRTYADSPERLAALLSAHIYFGLALLLIATLHTGFRFGWNVHTLAYVLMCLVIGSGIFGVVVYRRFPRLMTDNRSNMTQSLMFNRLAALNNELQSKALSLDEASAAMVLRAVETTAIGGSGWRQLSGRYPDCTTAAAIAAMATASEPTTDEIAAARRTVRVLLEEKGAMLTRLRRDIRYKAMMDVWLYIHIPITFALISALTAHIGAEFFLW
jgi:hypothetical protein